MKIKGDNNIPQFLCHFSSENKGQYLILELNEEKELFEKLPAYYRKCYITDFDLEERIENFGPAEKILTKFLPDPGKTMSGEFGEILSYQMIIEMYKDFNLFGPKKWLWKVDRNEPMKKTDVILFGVKDEGKASIDDIIVASEIKSKATVGAFHPLQDAIDGSRDDYVKRMAITLSWLEEQYTRLNDVQALKSIKRFVDAINPNYGPYKKHYKAITVIDSNMVFEELGREIDFSVKVLKKDWKKIKKECEGFGASYDGETKKLSFSNVKREDIIQSECRNKEEILQLYDLYNFKLGDYSDVTVISIEGLKNTYEAVYRNIVGSYKGVANE
ncbi:Hachiman antiphage defense system protein HamA [Bacillus thuringiensis]|uniref:Hachiman antiphage defense system protein HamA n=1 Tax=Bacillus thuringiensis TaxID=1428 RepID=UPI002FBEF05D